MATTIEEFVSVLTERSIDVRRDIPGSTLTTYRIGGSLKYCVVLRSQQDVEAISDVIARYFSGALGPDDVITLGKGSNVLVSDRGFQGIVFLCEDDLARVDSFEFHGDDNYEVRVTAGEALPAFARQCAPQECGGLSFYVGIPGSIGGAIAMNAGGHGCQTSEVLIDCNVLDVTTGSVVTYSTDECDFSYRHSRFVSTDVIFRGRFRGITQPADAIKKEIDEIVKWRRDNQPGGRNVGSVFQNPSGLSSGELIERSNLKGFSIGGAHISDKHANFIQADQNASADDVRRLIKHVQAVVLDHTGVMLAPEVRFVGDYSDG